MKTNDNKHLRLHKMIMEKITIDTFITDEKVNKVFISSLMDTPTGGLDAKTRKPLKKEILGSGDCDQLINTQDVWARDYMPIQLTENVFLSYIYRPDYLVKDEDGAFITNWQLHGVYSRRDKSLLKDKHIVEIPIVLDGGNVIKAELNGNPCMIMCDKVLKENRISKEAFEAWWKEWWKSNFEGTEMELILLPWEGEELNPIGHADGIVRYLGNGYVLMTNYADFDEWYEDDHADKLVDALTRRGDGGRGLDREKIIMLRYLDKQSFKSDSHFRHLFDNTWGYINYLQVGRNILVPSLGHDKLDDEALKQIRDAFKCAGNEVKVRLIGVDMLSILKDKDGKTNSGGALNCLTWTVKE